MPDDRQPKISLPSVDIRRRIEDEFSGESHGFNDYSLERLIGEGGFGHVYLARQHALERDVVIKTMIDGARNDVRAFMAEAVVLAQLAHPRILPIYDAGHDVVHGFFFVTQYLEGDSWAAVLDRNDERENVDILLAVCHAVAYAHGRGVLHRDLKPANILLGSHGEIFVMDWGLAVPVPGKSRFADILAAPVADEIHGTPCYMAPEMARPDPAAIGICSDVYLLGAILFEILTGHPPHHLGGASVCIEAARTNRLVDHGDDHELMAVARKAMATEPGDRYPSVMAFRDAVHDVHIHRDSISLTHQAIGDLEQARHSQHYEVYAEAVFGLKRALQLWPENPAATVRLREARLAYAEQALERGDLDLAASQLNPHDPEHNAMVERLEHEHQARQERATAVDRLRDAEMQILDGGERTWVLRHDVDLADRSRWVFNRCSVETTGGALQLSDGQPQVAVFQEDIIGNLRIRFEARVVGHHPTDLSCFFLAPRDEAPTEMIERGYQIKYGAYHNSVNLLIRAGRRLWSQPDSPLVRDRWYRFEIQRLSGVLALKVDGHLIFAEEDPQPIGGEQFSRFGFVGWEAAVQYRHLQIYQPSVARRESIIDLAHRHLELGNYQTATDLFADVLVSESEPAERVRAEHGIAQSRHLAELALGYEVMRTTVQQHFENAIVELSGDGLHVDISHRHAQTLEPLRGLPITSFNCDRNEIADLGPLRGMPLTDLNCASNLIEDLSPLAKLPLKRLLTNANRIMDLLPLRGMPLETVNLSHNPLGDLGALTGMRLITCMANGCHITDLAPLAAGRLNLLLVTGNGIADLAPLARQPLSHLNINANRITDLLPLATCPILVLDVSNNQIEDIDCLASLGVEELHLEGNPVSDIGSVVTRLPLGYLSCDARQLADVEVLRTLDLDLVQIHVANADERERLEKLDLAYVEIVERG